MKTKSKAQQAIIDHLDSGGRLDLTYSGLRPRIDGWSKHRTLHPVTERVVKEHFAGRLSTVYAKSPRRQIPFHFICLHEDVETNVNGGTVISIKDFA